MKTIAGIFQSSADAQQVVAHLRSNGIAEDRINLLAPHTTGSDVDAEVPTTETEQPGMGKAVGGVVGGAIGVAGGLPLGAAAASLFVPGVGPIIAAGLIGAALLGAGGAAAGVTAGGALENSVDTGLPHDELYVYEDALRKGRTVVIIGADDDEEAERLRESLTRAGAESVDAARESWWIGLRDAEQEQYTGQGRDFNADEPRYRRGFEASLHPSVRGKSYEQAADVLRQRHHDDYGDEAFRCGYERGCVYLGELKERHKG